MQTRIKNTMKAYLARDGVACPGSLWSRSGLEWLSRREDPDPKNLASVYACLDAQLKEVSGRVRRIAVSRKAARILMSAPGIGEFISVLAAAGIGDVKRFGCPKSLVSYAGLCPGVHQSGGTSRTQAGPYCNHWLKRAMYEASGRAVMLGDNRYARHYARVKRRRGWKTARRSAARKMLTDVYWMLRNEEPYRES